MILRDYFGCGPFWSSSRFAANQEHAVRNRREDCEQIHEAFVVFELTLFEMAAALERFEVLLDGPACSIVVDDRDLLFDRGNWLVSEQNPLDRRLARGRRRFPYPHDVDGDAR